MSQTLQKKESAVVVSEGSPAELIRQAVSGGANLEQLEKLLNLQERWEANEAKKAYHKAMAAFKAEPPTIKKDKKVSYKTSTGTTSYTHATLANVTEKINAGLSKHGLSASWSVAQANGQVSVTCKITHEKGHSESTTLTAGPDNSGSKNPIQAIGSAISYLERYTLLALIGLATADMDNDAGGLLPPKPPVKMPEASTSNISRETPPSQPVVYAEIAPPMLSALMKSQIGKGLVALAERNGLPQQELEKYVKAQSKRYPALELFRGNSLKEIEHYAAGGFQDLV